jgi:mono/diheme cytochrome c family protein
MKMARTFTYKTVFLFFLFFTFSVLSVKAQNDPAAGEQLYKMNCAACHKIDKKLVGPALGGVTEKREQEWLIAWIKNNQELRESGDADAIAVYEEYNGSPMTAFPQLSDEDILNILAYTDQAWDLIQNPPVAEAGAEGEAAAAGEGASSGLSIRFVLAVLSGLLLVIVLVLVRLKNMLKTLKGEDTSNMVEDTFSFSQWYLKNSKLMIVTTIVVAVILLNGAWVWLTTVGVDQGYQPEQPIAFSHELHAGPVQRDTVRLREYLRPMCV